MLASFDPHHLARVWFPLGEQTKDETRAEADRAGLAVARRADSQEACFLAGDDYRAFLARHGLPARQGAIVDADGNELGAHAGVWGFTPGQRRGIGVVAERPLYVIDTNAAANTVAVGPRESLARTRVRATGRLYLPVAHVEAKLRYRSAPVPASVSDTDEGFELELAEPVYGVARGQAAVLYDGDLVVGCGTVTAAT
jgi:tRNA-specific 2-thiouridylase